MPLFFGLLFKLAKFALKAVIFRGGRRLIKAAPKVAGVVAKRGGLKKFIFGSAVRIGIGIIAGRIARGLAGRNEGPTRFTTTVTGSIVPARWVVGEYRVGGVLAFYHEKEGPNGAQDLHQVLLISEGECDSITGLWINGKSVPITRTREVRGWIPDRSIKW